MDFTLKSRRTTTLVSLNQIHTRSIVLTLVTQTVINIDLTAISCVAWSTFTAENSQQEIEFISKVAGDARTSRVRSAGRAILTRNS